MIRHTFIAALAASACIPALAQERIDGTHTGSWFDPAASGHGFNFQLLPNRIGILYWYAYDATGRPIFFYGQTPQPIPVDATEARFETLYLEGMRFGTFDPSARRSYTWGTMSLRFPTCGRATLNYSGTSSPQFPNAPSGSGTIALTKLADTHGQECGATGLPGMWRGLVSDGTQADLVAIILLPDGSAAYFNEDAEVGGLGRWTLDGTRLRATLRACAVSPPTNCVDVIASGTLKPQVALNATFTASDGSAGRMTIEPTRSVSRPTALAALAGQYRDGTGLTASVQANGEFTATDSVTRCSYRGQISQPTFGRNHFAVTSTVSGCPLTGPLTGAAVVGDAGEFGDNRLLEVILTGGTHGPTLIRARRD